MKWWCDYRCCNCKLRKKDSEASTVEAPKYFFRLNFQGWNCNYNCECHFLISFVFHIIHSIILQIRYISVAWLPQTSLFKIPWLFPDKNKISPTKLGIKNVRHNSGFWPQLTVVLSTNSLRLTRFQHTFLKFNFPSFSSKCQFSLTQHKIPRLFSKLEEFFFPDHFLTCDNPVWHATSRVCMVKLNIAGKPLSIASLD